MSVTIKVSFWDDGSGKMSVHTGVLLQDRLLCTLRSSLPEDPSKKLCLFCVDLFQEKRNGRRRKGNGPYVCVTDLDVVRRTLWLLFSVYNPYRHVLLSVSDPGLLTLRWCGRMGPEEVTSPLQTDVNSVTKDLKDNTRRIGLGLYVWINELRPPTQFLLETQGPMVR